MRFNAAAERSELLQRFTAPPCLARRNRLLPSIIREGRRIFHHNIEFPDSPSRIGPYEPLEAHPTSSPWVLRITVLRITMEATMFAAACAGKPFRNTQGAIADDPHPHCRRFPHHGRNLTAICSRRAIGPRPRHRTAKKAEKILEKVNGVLKLHPNETAADVPIAPFTYSSSPVCLPLTLAGYNTGD